jgi:HD superfamily phosphohydrolase
MENVENQTNTNIKGSESEKSVDNVQDVANNEAGEITLEQFRNALENNIECKGYFDSLCDKTVNSRLDKGIESWKEKNLNNLIETEINKRYPQKTEAEIKFEEQQKALEKAQEEKRQLELQIKYQSLMAENKLPMEILDFVAGKDIETTISNIGRFKELTQKYVDAGVNDEVARRFQEGAHEPPRSQGLSISRGSMWDI